MESDDTAYLVEYRRAAGYNTQQWDQVTETWESYDEGVYVYLRPGRSIENRNEDTFQPYDNLDFRNPIIATVGSPFYDPARGIRVRVLNDYNTRVRVELSRDP
jgi:hypothetical protein